MFHLPFALEVAITLLLVLIDLALRITAVFVIPRQKRPTTATAWLMAIFFVPYVGILVFLVFGMSKLPRRRREKQNEVTRFIRETSHGEETAHELGSDMQWLSSLIKLNRDLGAMPMMGGNRSSLHSNYRDSIADMTDAVRKAKRYVHAEFYIFLLDETTEEFFNALADARRRGVTVRVLLDHVANVGYPTYKKTLKWLDQTGMQWHLMMPFQPLRGRIQRPDLRNHRKLLVVDGEVAFMGSQNMVDRGYQKKKNRARGLQWKDLIVRLEGPIVLGINAIFITDWYQESDELLLRDNESPNAKGLPAAAPDEIDCQLVPSGPEFGAENNLRLFNALMYGAQKEIILTSPYFVPDDSLLYAITTAVQRGVHLELFVSQMSDQFMVYHAQRSFYEELLRVGVVIYLYRAPFILHAKHFTIDDQVAVVGSSNMDMRSFSLNAELSLMVHSKEFVADLHQVQEAYRRDSILLTREKWREEPFWKRSLDTVMRLTASLQ